MLPQKEVEKRKRKHTQLAKQVFGSSSDVSSEVNMISIMEQSGKMIKGVPLIPIKSSHLDLIGYDFSNDSILIEFYTNRSVYMYYGRDSRIMYGIFLSMLTSVSKGKEFYKLIRNRGLPFKRIL